MTWLVITKLAASGKRAITSPSNKSQEFPFGLFGSEKKLGELAYLTGNGLLSSCRGRKEKDALKTSQANFAWASGGGIV